MGWRGMERERERERGSREGGGRRRRVKGGWVGGRWRDRCEATTHPVEELRLSVEEGG